MTEKEREYLNIGRLQYEKVRKEKIKRLALTFIDQCKSENMTFGEAKATFEAALRRLEKTVAETLLEDISE